MPPPVGVWLSEPIRVFPGAPKRSRWTWWQIPFPGREYQMPCFFATEAMNRWSSAFSKPDCRVLWSMRQGLVDLQADFPPLFEDAVHGVRFQNLFRECKSHVYFSFCLHKYS